MATGTSWLTTSTDKVTAHLLQGEGHMSVLFERMKALRRVLDEVLAVARQ